MAMFLICKNSYWMMLIVFLPSLVIQLAVPALADTNNDVGAFQGYLHDYQYDVARNVKRVPGSEFLGKRAPGSEFLGKRIPGSEFLGKRVPGSEFLGKRVPGSEFLGKRAPGSEFLAKRVPGSEFLGKRTPGSRLHGKHGSYFLGDDFSKRSPEYSNGLSQSDRDIFFNSLADINKNNQERQ